jgi:hemerythrin
MLIEWKVGYQTHYEAVDSQHQALVSLLNRFFNEVTHGVSLGQVKRTVEDLESYARFHFSEEEAIMRKVSSLNFNMHERDHRLFEQKVAEINSLLDIDYKAAALMAVDYLSSWVVHHVLLVDQKYLTAPVSRQLYGRAPEVYII